MTLICRRCCDLPWRRPATGCPYCGEPFETEPMPHATEYLRYRSSAALLEEAGVGEEPCWTSGSKVRPYARRLVADRQWIRRRTGERRYWPRAGR